IIAASDLRVLPVADDRSDDSVAGERDTNVAVRARQGLHPPTIHRPPVPSMNEDDDGRRRGAMQRRVAGLVQVELSLRVARGRGVGDIGATINEVALEVVIATRGPEPEQPERQHYGQECEEAFSASRRHLGPDTAYEHGFPRLAGSAKSGWDRRCVGAAFGYGGVVGLTQR